MAKGKTSRRTNTANIVGAGAAGGSIGTAIAAMAAQLPPDSRYKALLTVTAPLISLTISGMWLFVRTIYIEPYANQKKQQAADAAMEKILTDARATAARVAADPNSSEEHKRQVRKMVEDLERMRFEKITERMEVIESS
jgi:hypothetical protein